MTDATSDLLPRATVHHIRDACLCLATQRAARRLARRFEAGLGDEGTAALRRGLAGPG